MHYRRNTIKSKYKHLNGYTKKRHLPHLNRILVWEYENKGVRDTGDYTPRGLMLVQGRMGTATWKYSLNGRLRSWSMRIGCFQGVLLSLTNYDSDSVHIGFVYWIWVVKNNKIRPLGPLPRAFNLYSIAHVSDLRQSTHWKMNSGPT